MRGERLGHFCDFEPAEFGRLDLGPVSGDALRQFRETIGIAGVEVGIRKRGFICDDFGLQPLDLARQPVVIALVLVA